MIADADLPPLQSLIPALTPSVVLRCMSDEEIRSIQREAFKAGLEKAAVTAEKIRFASPASPTERAFNTGIESAAKCIRFEKSGRPTAGAETKEGA